MKPLLLAAMLLALPAAASDFGANYPAGSISDSAAAQAALKAADAEMARIVQDEKRREAECYRGFLVNSCRDDVRRERQLAEREVKRVQLEAHDLQRRLDAERVVKQRAEDAKARAAEDAQRPQKEEAARAASQARESELRKRGANEASTDPSTDPDRQGPKQDRLTAAERAENVRKYQQKQAQAEKRAEEKDAERKKNEQRRAEKRKQMEQRQTEQEAVRKKAAEALRQ